jgi:hypothetical protein
MSTNERVQINWQWQLFYVHSIMMVKSSQSREGGGAHPPPFTLSTITIKVVVYAPTERTNTLLLFLLYPLFCRKIVSDELLNAAFQS